MSPTCVLPSGGFSRQRTGTTVVARFVPAIPPKFPTVPQIAANSPGRMDVISPRDATTEGLGSDHRLDRQLSAGSVFVDVCRHEGIRPLFCAAWPPRWRDSA